MCYRNKYISNKVVDVHIRMMFIESVKLYVLLLTSIALSAITESSF